MRFKVCTIRDRAADVYSQPFFVPSIGIAIRHFGDEINRSADNNQLFRHAEDFDLFLLGEWDDSDGSFDSCRPQQIAVGKDLKVSNV